VKSVGEEGETLEVSYYIYLKDAGLSGQFIREISAVPGVQYANLFYDEAVV